MNTGIPPDELGTCIGLSILGLILIIVMTIGVIVSDKI